MFERGRGGGQRREVVVEAEVVEKHLNVQVLPACPHNEHVNKSTPVALQHRRSQSLVRTEVAAPPQKCQKCEGGGEEGEEVTAAREWCIMHVCFGLS